MYADVVVLTYQAPDINFFSYQIPKKLEKQIKIGQLVQVPFGKRNPMGIIIETRDQRPETRNIKSITSIVFSQPLLLPYQIKLLKWMSFYYLASMVNCLEAMLPRLPKRLQSTNHRGEHLRGEKVNTSNQLLGTRNQILILVPTLNRIPETLAKFPKAKNYAVYHNELKMSEKFNTWLKILSGKSDYIFGSRSAIFTPCPNLKEIVIYDEHDGAYKDERSPYFDTLTIAQKIKELTRAQIKIIDPAPKIQTYFNYKAHLQGVSQASAKLHLGGDKSSVSTKIISMQNEKLAGNFSPISSYLQSELIKRKKTNQNILLFLNKKKESGNLFCKNCKFNDYFEKQPEFCPKCKSADIYFNVLNTQSLATEIKKLTHHSSNNQALSTRYQVSGIDIATATIFYSPIVNKYGLVAYIQPDPLLIRADFSNQETLFAYITNLKKLLIEKGTLIIQTYNIDNPILKSATKSDYPAYFNNQLKERQLLSYPPFALLIKLTIKGDSHEKVEKAAHQLVQTLNSTIQPFNHPTIQLLGPYQPIFFSKKPTYNIILKYKIDSYSLENREKAIKNLSPILKSIPKDFQIVVEPESIN